MKFGGVERNPNTPLWGPPRDLASSPWLIGIRTTLCRARSLRSGGCFSQENRHPRPGLRPPLRACPTVAANRRRRALDPVPGIPRPSPSYRARRAVDGVRCGRLVFDNNENIYRDSRFKWVGGGRGENLFITFFATTVFVIT